MQKLLTFFSANILAYRPYFNDTLTNDIVSLEQLGPDVYICRVWSEPSLGSLCLPFTIIWEI